MQLRDLPEEIQIQILAWSNAYMRAHPGVDIHLTSHLDEAVVAGMELEATRHNSKCENLWQGFSAFRNAVLRNEATPAIWNLVDQCLLENKPKTIVP